MIVVVVVLGVGVEHVYYRAVCVLGRVRHMLRLVGVRMVVLMPAHHGGPPSARDVHGDSVGVAVHHARGERVLSAKGLKGSAEWPLQPPSYTREPRCVVPFFLNSIP